MFSGGVVWVFFGVICGSFLDDFLRRANVCLCVYVIFAGDGVRDFEWLLVSVIFW